MERVCDYFQYAHEPQLSFTERVAPFCTRQFFRTHDDQPVNTVNQAREQFDEATYVSLKRLHAPNNDRAGALRSYHECVTIVHPI
jgi:hypothetical protein